MKIILIVSALAAVALAETSSFGVCFNKIESSLSSKALGDLPSSCTAHYSGYSHINDDLTQYAHHLIKKSYDFLILASGFGEFNKNRPGFEKLHHSTSDQAWNDAIDLMKYQAKRGGKVTLADCNQDHTYYDGIKKQNAQLQSIRAMTELSSLGMALDYEKIMAKVTHTIHKEVSHAAGEKAKYYDPHASQYLEEEVIEKQADTIRKLAGYVADLSKIMNVEDKKDVSDLALQLFDEYLAK